jgi:hypothetical protein
MLNPVRLSLGVGKDQPETRGIALSGHAPVNENTVNGNERYRKESYMGRHSERT